MKYLFTITTDEGRNYFEEEFAAPNDFDACDYAEQHELFYTEGKTVESCTDLQDLKFDKSLVCELFRMDDDDLLLIASQYTTCPAINSKINDWQWMNVNY